MRHLSSLLLVCCLLTASQVGHTADFHIAGPTIELRRLQYCTDCDNPLVVTTIAPGAAVRCPHCTSVQRRLPNRLLEARVYQVCPSCASRLDVAHLDPRQQLRCGTCGLAQYVLPEAVQAPSSQSGTGRIPPAHVVPDTDGRAPTWTDQHLHRHAPPVSETHTPHAPGAKAHDTHAPAPTTTSPRPSPAPSTSPRAPTDHPKAVQGETETTLPPFDPRDPATLELYLQHDDALRARREAAAQPAPPAADPESIQQRAPARQLAPAPQPTAPAPPRHEEAPSVQPHMPALPPMPEGNPAHRAAQAPTSAPHAPADAGRVPHDTAHAPAAAPSHVQVHTTAPPPQRQAAWSPQEAHAPETRPAPRDPSLLHAARVNGEPILVADVERLLREAMEAMQVELGADAHTQAGQALLMQKRTELQERIRSTLIDRELIRQAALQEGHRPDEQAVHDFADALAAQRGHVRSAALLNEARFQLILEDMHRRHARIAEPVRPADVRAYYDANLDTFREPARAQLRNLVIYRNRTGRPDPRSATVIAQEVARKLRNGADYSALIHRYSECPFRDEGGHLPSAHGTTTPLATLTRPVRMEVNRKGEGEVVGPVETVSAVVFSQIEALLPAAPQPFGEVAEAIRHQLILQRREAAFETWVDTLRRDAVIEVLE